CIQVGIGHLSALPEGKFAAGACQQLGGDGRRFPSSQREAGICVAPALRRVAIADRVITLRLRTHHPSPCRTPMAAPTVNRCGITDSLLEFSASGSPIRRREAAAWGRLLPAASCASSIAIPRRCPGAGSRSLAAAGDEAAVLPVRTGRNGTALPRVTCSA